MKTETLDSSVQKLTEFGNYTMDDIKELVKKFHLIDKSQNGVSTHPHPPSSSSSSWSLEVIR